VSATAVCVSVCVCVYLCVCLCVCVCVLGILYSEFHYETPPPAYSSLDHTQQQHVSSHTTTTTTTTTAAAAAAAAAAANDDDDDDCASAIHSNPPSYRSHVSRTCRHVTSDSTAPPPDYIQDVSEHTADTLATTDVSEHIDPVDCDHTADTLATNCCTDDTATQCTLADIHCSSYSTATLS